MRIFNIEEGIVQTIQSLYASPGSSVLLDGEVGERFPSTEEVHEGRGLWYWEEDSGIQDNMLQNFYRELTTNEFIRNHRPDQFSGNSARPCREAINLV